MHNPLTLAEPCNRGALKVTHQSFIILEETVGPAQELVLIPTREASQAGATHVIPKVGLSRAVGWHLLVADDYHLEASGPEYRPALPVFFVVCDVVGIPLSWHKTSGGDVVTWVGFELLHCSYQLEVSQRRAD